MEAPGPARVPSRVDLAWIAALTVLYLALHLPDLGHPGEMAGDEGWYIPAARAWLAPGQLDPNPNHPPLGKMLIAAGMAVLGDRPAGWRASSLVFGLFSVLLTYLFGRALFPGHRAAGLAGFLLTVDFLFFVQSRLGTLDPFLSTFLLAGLLAGWKATRSERPAPWLGAAGALLGLATATKLNGLAGLPVLAAFAFLRSPRLPRWRGGMAGAVLGSLALAFCLAHVPLLARGAPLSWMLYAGNLQHHFSGTFAHEQMGSMLDWVTLRKPFWFLWLNDPARQELTTLAGWGNFVFWWGFWPIMAVRAARGSRGDRAVACAYLGLWLCWLGSFHVRNGVVELKGGFFFYMLPGVPFMALAVGRQLALASRSPLGMLAGGLFLAGMAWATELFWPTLVAATIPYSRMDEILALAGNVVHCDWGPLPLALAALLTGLLLAATPPGPAPRDGSTAGGAAG